MSEHTSKPWMLHDMEAATIVTAKKPGQYIAICNAARLTDEQNKENAEDIIRSVNAHENGCRYFHNALRILRSIDRYELDEIGFNLRDEQWIKFRDDPYSFFITCETATAEAIWRLMETRQPT